MNQVQNIFDILTDIYEVSPWNKAQIQADLSKENTHYFFVYAGQETVGFLALQELGEEWEVTNLAVKKKYQRQGFASQLLEKLTVKSEPIYLEVRISNLAARSLYKKYGFEEVGQRKQYYHNPTEDAVIMVRKNRLE